ncbi:TIGR03899 family protein [Vibrio sp. RC27]
MEKEKTSVIIAPPTETTSNTQKRTKNHIKDSASQVMQIAQSHGLDALLVKTKDPLSPLERAINRENRLKEQRQKNLEQIMKIALSSCKNETAGEPDQDWLLRFFTMAQEIHNSSMQRLWAQVLKLEVTNPGSTSMKALKVLKDMTPKEAQILQRAATIACSFGQDSSKKICVGIKSQGSIFSFGKRDNSISISLGNFHLPYSSLLVLIELGLLHASELESGEIELNPPLVLHYQAKRVSLSPLSKGIRLLYFRFSPTGNELCKLLGNKSNADYFEQLSALLSQKFTIESDEPSSIDHTI